MKQALRITRLVVGLLFIFSGLVKLNDPAGTAIKLEEYFEVFATDFGSFFHVFVPYALAMALVFCAAEVVLGVAMLMRYQMRVTTTAALVLIVFFTFLTFYSAYFNKVTDCGCFGDFIKLTPWTSFTKDIVLTVLVVFLFINRDMMPNMVAKPTRHIVMGAVSIAFLAIGFYAIRHLPYADWRPYHVGAHIPTYMKNSAAYQYEYRFKDKDGSIKTFAEYPDNAAQYEFVEMNILNPEAGPRITDYRVWNDDGDYTPGTFEGAHLFLIVRHTDQLEKADAENLAALSKEMRNTPRLKTEVLSAAASADYDKFRHEYQIAAPYYYIDGTVAKTIMRTEGGVWLLKDGYVLGKWAAEDAPSPQAIRDLLAGA